MSAPWPTAPSPPSERSAAQAPIGPRIWTGTHFLPRFVGESFVPGEGPCYFYDDGTHCKTVIDGEPVNPHWGVTKAGKPRKRLAVACLTCREKKIKCDPDFPRCVQCEKFSRECRFKNAPRVPRLEGEQPQQYHHHHHHHYRHRAPEQSRPSSSSAAAAAAAAATATVTATATALLGPVDVSRPTTDVSPSALSFVLSAEPSDRSSFASARGTSPPVSQVRPRRLSLGDVVEPRAGEGTPEHRIKRRRHESRDEEPSGPQPTPGFVPAARPSLPLPRDPTPSSPATSQLALLLLPDRDSLRSSPTPYSSPPPSPSPPAPGTSGPETASVWSDRPGSGALDAPSRFPWQRDPYDVDPDLVVHLVDLYFDRVNCVGYRVFPRGPFIRWVHTGRGKSVDDLMLLHTMLMVASNFSTRPDRRLFAREFGRVARYAIDRRRDHWSLQLVQCRLLLALQNVVANQSTEAWDVCGGAIRAAIGLGLHLESSMAPDRDESAPLYGFGRRTFVECKRATFWALYMMDVRLRSFPCFLPGFETSLLSHLLPVLLLLLLPSPLSLFPTDIG